MNVSHQSTSNSEAMRSIKEQLPKVKPSTELFDVDSIHLLDSGGQPQFLDVLPLLFHNESLHIVVIRLTERLDDKPKVRFYNKGKDVHTLPDHLTLSNREIIERACQMAEAQAIFGKSVPKVMVVGTHKDKLGNNCEAKLKEINKELTKVHQKYNRVLIRKSSNEVIFAVNAMAPDGEERQQYTEELQKCILEAVKETGDVIDVPLKWLALHLDLDKIGSIVRKSECYRRGEILEMERSEVENALKFFNKFSLLLYYPDDVPDLVFTKMYPLISRLSRLIKASFITPGSCVTAPYDRLRQKGLFNKSFLPTIFQDLYDSGEELCDDEEEFPHDEEEFSDDEEKSSNDEEQFPHDGEEFSDDEEKSCNDEEEFPDDEQEFSDDEEKFSNDEEFPDDEEEFSDDGEELSNDEEEIPDDGEELSDDEEKFSDDEEESPDDKEDFSDDGGELSNDEEEIPDDEEKFSDDEEESPDDKEEFSDDEEESPDDKEEFSDDGGELSNDEEEIPDDGEELTDDEEKFSSDEEESPDDKEEFSNDDFLKLLECLKIAVHVGDDDYFLPSALSLRPPSNDSSFKSSCVPLAFTWGGRILPHGFFLTLVVELLQKKRFNFKLKEDIAQCREVIQMSAPDSKIDIPGFVKLVDRKRWIEICYSCSTTRYCSDLCEILGNAIDRVVKRFKHTGIESPKIGFRCRLCPSDDHYCILSHDQTMVQCNHSDSLLTPDMLCWIKRSEGQ